MLTSYICVQHYSPNKIREQTYAATVPDEDVPDFWMAALVHQRVRNFVGGTGTGGANVEEVDAQIVGGVHTPPGLHTFLVGLLQASVSDDYNAQFCGGTLYNEIYVITAAHCVDFIVSTSYLEILVGTQTLSDSGKGRRIAVADIIIDPKWTPRTFNFDVAILKLATAVTDISSAQLAPRNTEPVPNAQSTVSGWGSLASGGSFPFNLQTVVVPNWDRATCNGRDAYNGQILSSMFCAGETGKDSCQGDSGGPITDITNTTLIGIVSWGFGCALPLKPGVYARIGNTEIHDFITQTAVVVAPPTSPPTRAPTRSPTVTPQPTSHPTQSPTRSPTVFNQPTPLPTQSPTASPTGTSTGVCAAPHPLTLGPNAFNTAPASGFTVSTEGTSCDFDETGYAGEATNISASLFFKLCAS